MKNTFEGKLYMFKKILIPVIAFIVSIVFQYFCLPMFDLYSGTILLLVIRIVLMPLFSFLYAKQYVSKSRHKWWLSIAMPLVFALSCLCEITDDEIVYTLLEFIWCELWSLLGCKKHKPESGTADNEDQSNM